MATLIPLVGSLPITVTFLIRLKLSVIRDTNAPRTMRLSVRVLLALIHVRNSPVRAKKFYAQQLAWMQLILRRGLSVLEVQLFLTPAAPLSANRALK